MQFEYDYHGFKGYLENVGLTLTLLLSNEPAEDILTMDECLDALDQSYRELSSGLARSARRSDIVTKTPSDDAVYSLKMMGGVVPGLEVAVVRINSDILTWPETDGKGSGDGFDRGGSFDHGLRASARSAQGTQTRWTGNQ